MTGPEIIAIIEGIEAAVSELGKLKAALQANAAPSGAEVQQAESAEVSGLAADDTAADKAASGK